MSTKLGFIRAHNALGAGLVQVELAKGAGIVVMVLSAVLILRMALPSAWVALNATVS